MMVSMSASAAGLCDFIDASPSPFHAWATVAARLAEAGFAELDETDRGRPTGPLLHRAGWLTGRLESDGPDGPFRIVGAHPTAPTCGSSSTRTVWSPVGAWALEPYGECGRSCRPGPGHQRAAVGPDGAGVGHRLVRIDDPILRVPQLAIHLAEDRKSVTLDPQRHVNAVWGVAEQRDSFVAYVAERAGVQAADVLAADLMTHDLTPSTVVGADASLLSAPRLDNQASCYAGMEALLALEPASAPRGWLPVLVLFDHEEVGVVIRPRRPVEFLPASSSSGSCSRPAATGKTSCAGCRRCCWCRPTWPRHPPQLSRAARARPPDRGQRRAGAEGAPKPAVCHRRTHRGGVRAGLPPGRGRPAALRAPRRPPVRFDDRAAGVGPHRHPDRRCRRPAARDAFRA